MDKTGSSAAIDTKLRSPENFLDDVRAGTPAEYDDINWDAVGQEAAALLSRYIQFDTTNPPGNEAAATAFLADYLRDCGFDPRVIESGAGRANLIMRWPAQHRSGNRPLLLYAHADVVPADAGQWSVDPFGGQIKDGFVWGRGALDDKGLGVIFIQALRLLKQQGLEPNRDIVLLIAADEERCGGHGVAWLLDHHPELIDAEYVWDEGGMGLSRANGNKSYHIAIAEKTALTVKLVAHGTAGHASIPRAGNPHERMVRALYHIKQWHQPIRQTGALLAMLRALSSSQPFPRSLLFTYADQTLCWSFLRYWLAKQPMFAPLVRNTISLTMLHGGQATNILPTRSEARLDIRLLPGEAPALFVEQLRDVIADPEVLIEVEREPLPQITSPVETVFFQTLTEVLQSTAPVGPVIPYLTPGATDSRFFRAAGMKAYGFMPMMLDSHELNRVHGIDERVSIANLKLGIQIVLAMLKKI